MRSLCAVLVLAIGPFGLVVATAQADVAPEDVRKAIDRGAAYLKGQQRADGSWVDYIRQSGGVSALATLALLNSGVDPSDEQMQKALNYLRKIKPERTYTVALQTMVFARAEPDRDRVLLDRNVKWLQATQLKEGPDKGGWSYPEVGFSADNSNAQFALLALHEAERVGVTASAQTWRLAKKYWEDCQNHDGSWQYNRSMAAGGTGSMTCAGISSLVIAMDRVQATSARVVGDRIECCNSRTSSDANRIEQGLRWLGRHYSVGRNPGSSGEIWLLYYLYGLERAGRLTARRFLPLPPRPGRPDRADWYREGTESLLRSQDALSGFWTGKGPAESNPVVGTSLALLFLSKGRWPVLLGKLQHAPGDDWNEHRNDIGNLTRYVETRWRRDLTWQVVDFRLATVDDMVQTPVLYLCGSQDPFPKDEEQRKELAQKIRDYLDRGGFLFAEAYCNGERFDRSFREFMRLVFSEPEYKLRLLEAEHPIWYAEEKVEPQFVRPLWGVEFGCRTSVVYAAPERTGEAPRPPLSCLWDLARPGRGEKYGEKVQAQIDAAMSLGINVLAYATNRELKSKEDFFRIAPTRRPRERLERGQLYVATLKHPGGCNSAPRAIVNLMDAAAREMKVRTNVRDDLLDMTDEALFDYHLVFMHGRTTFRLTEDERQRLREFIERGGMVMADSICASRAFTESFRREMAAIFPNRKLEKIPPTDPLFSTTYGGFDLGTVSRRDPSSSARGQRLEAAVRRVPPDLEGIKFGDHWGVIFSPYDLSCALEKRDSLECHGYTREDAARLGLNVVLYSLQQ